MPNTLPFRKNAFFGPALASALLAGIVGYPGLSRAIDIQFDYSFDSNGFFAGVNESRRLVLEAAASLFENFLTDDLTAIESNSDGTFIGRPRDPSTGNIVELSGLSVAADTVIVYVGADDIGGLGLGGPSGFRATNATQDFIDNVFARGEGNGTEADVRGTSADEVAPWGGSITFDTGNLVNGEFIPRNWYFDTEISTDDDIPFAAFDFFSVALHELAHVLGFGITGGTTFPTSWDNLIDANGDFIGANSVAVNNNMNVDLTPDGAHWINGTQSRVFGTTTGQEAAMDPSIFNGTRKYFTELDMAGLEDIGWTVAAISAE